MQPMKPPGRLKTNSAGKPVAIEYACPACDMQLKSTPDEAGQDFPCPTCNTLLTVPCKPDVQAWQAKEAERQREASQRRAQEQAEAAERARLSQAQAAEQSKRSAEYSAELARGNRAVAHENTATWMILASRIIGFMGMLYAIAGAMAIIVGGIMAMGPGASPMATAYSGAMLIVWGLVGLLSGVVIIGFGAALRMVAFIGRDVREMREAQRAAVE
jgi:uncharacterized Zn finger protein (UPF0148 family)